MVGHDQRGLGSHGGQVQVDRDDDVRWGKSSAGECRYLRNANGGECWARGGTQSWSDLSLAGNSDVVGEHCQSLSRESTLRGPVHHPLGAQIQVQTLPRNVTLCHYCHALVTTAHPIAVDDDDDEI